MTPAERITAAIGRLEQLKADSTPGPWWSTVAEVYSGTGLSDDIGVAFDFRYSTDAALTATLHRTIDAQLDLLNAANDMKGIYRLVDGEWTSSRFGHAVLVLADAILGES